MPRGKNEMKVNQSVRLSVTALTEAQLDILHRGSLKILSQVGVNVHSRELCTLLDSAGAKVEQPLRAYIPESLVERALGTAPSRIGIYDRSGGEVMDLSGTNCYFGTGSDLEYTIDSETQLRRESRIEDVALSARLCDRLDNIDFVMSYALPKDVPDTDCEVEQFRALLANTRKPAIMTQFSGVGTARRMHDLALEYCGGEAVFRQAPNYILYGQFVSPLQHDAGALERLVFCADHSIPLIYVPTIMMGASGPVTLAGALALANAECLAGLVMHQLRAPGAPFIYGGCVSPLDMKTTVFSYNSPEWRIADVALSQLSRRYDLPVFGTAGATDAKTVDAQAGSEWSYSLMIDALAGVNLIHDVGYMDSGLTGSLEALVVCDEIIGIVKRITSGFRIDGESLALDTIGKVGPAGHFMEEDHTLEHFRRDIWYPSLFERVRYDSWKEAGCRDVLHRAKDRVQELLSR